MFKIIGDVFEGEPKIFLKTIEILYKLYVITSVLRKMNIFIFFNYYKI